jgi:hypothetical protein
LQIGVRENVRTRLDREASVVVHVEVLHGAEKVGVLVEIGLVAQAFGDQASIQIKIEPTVLKKDVKIGQVWID